MNSPNPDFSSISVYSQLSNSARFRTIMHPSQFLFLVLTAITPIIHALPQGGGDTCAVASGDTCDHGGDDPCCVDGNTLAECTLHNTWAVGSCTGGNTCQYDPALGYGCFQ